jgi:hypothetical protein
MILDWSSAFAAENDIQTCILIARNAGQSHSYLVVPQATSVFSSHYE